MKKALIAAGVTALLLAGCGSSAESGTADSGKETFTVGMECGYAPFNW